MKRGNFHPVIIRSAAALLLWVAALAVPAAFAAESPSAMASPGPASDPAFLELKAYDLNPTGSVPQPLHAGDRVEYRITDAAVPAGSRLESTVEESALAEQGLDLTLGQDLRVEAIILKPGSITLPALVLKDASGNRVGRTYPQILRVVSSIAQDDPEPEKPVELKPPVGLKFPWMIVAAAALVALILLGLLIGWLVRWSRRRAAFRAAALPPAPPPPEDQAALSALAELEKKNLMATGRYKAHYFGVSEIVKRYIGARYRFDALESTTYELIRTLEAGKLAAPQTLDALDSLFQRLDEVKFTDHVPTEIDGRAVLEDARKIVLATRKPPEVLSAT